MLVGPDEQIVNTGSQFALQSIYEDTGKMTTAADSVPRLLIPPTA